MDFEPVMESQNGAAIALLIRYGLDAAAGSALDVIKCYGIKLDANAWQFPLFFVHCLG